jgi:hypothetical protein
MDQLITARLQMFAMLMEVSRVEASSNTCPFALEDADDHAAIECSRCRSIHSSGIGTNCIDVAQGAVAGAIGVTTP